MVSLAKTSEVAGVMKGRKLEERQLIYIRGWKKEAKGKREKVTTRKIWEKAHGQI